MHSQRTRLPFSSGTSIITRRDEAGCDAMVLRTGKGVFFSASTKKIDSSEFRTFADDGRMRKRQMSGKCLRWLMASRDATN